MKIVTKKQLFKKFELLINKNGCKYLSGTGIRKCFVFIRDRQEDQSYYSIIAKGNHIRGFKIRYEYPDGVGVNTFTSLFIPTLVGEKVSIPIMKKELIAKSKFKDFDKFSEEFIKNSQSLGWD